MYRRPDENLREYDLCIVGAGPVGITIAAELAYSGLSLCVIESGDVGKTAAADALKEVESEGIVTTPVSRERLFGGSSATWGGLSAPLDDIDFERRPWTDGWPLAYTDLVPYLERTTPYRYPGLSEFAYSEPPRGMGPLDQLSTKKFVATVPPVRYAMYRYLFERSGFDLLIATTVVAIEHQQHDGASLVSAVRCRSADGVECTVRARRFILAAGGIENARLMLDANIGNEHDQVGRGFMNHPVGYIGLVHLSRQISSESLFIRASDAARIQYVGLRLSSDYQRQHGLMNSYIGFEPFFGGSSWARIERHWYQVYLKFERRLPSWLRWTLPIIRPPLKTLRMRWFADMEPRHENRVTLSDARDEYGTRRAKVSYCLGDRDIRTIRTLFDQFKTGIESAGVGKIEADIEAIVNNIALDGSHHIGSTKMGLDSKSSVVNAQGKVHSAHNLYIAGTSVFPTAGNANPTFTAVALAIRLADYLRGGVDVSEPIPASDKRVVVIGGGRRVREDVIPALEHLEPLFETVGVFGRTRSVVFGRKRRYETRPISELSRDLATSAQYVYLAVPPHQVLSALLALPIECYGCELIIDTPAPTSSRVKRLLRKFKKVHVAEDGAYLPWLASVRMLHPSPKEIVADRSLFHYHGIALLKAIVGTEESPARISQAQKREGHYEFVLGSARARVTEPCNYAQGSLTIDGECVAWPDLTPAELELVGGKGARDTIVTKMLELKRVGLARMLTMIASGGEPYSFAAGLDDVLVDESVHKGGTYVPSVLEYDGVTQASPKFRKSGKK